ncbi:globin domain-containing protein, partial [Staphylococcus epidermidis]|uniref:globin domain-containing protein n=1 Tax=Staphylococcus epidermidis TaxID=1282 RepID=UPI0021B3AD5E
MIGEKALYEMIDDLYEVVEKDCGMNDLLGGDLKERSGKEKEFLREFVGGRELYREEDGDGMLKGRDMEFRISEYEGDGWVEKMDSGIEEGEVGGGV